MFLFKAKFIDMIFMKSLSTLPDLSTSASFDLTPVDTTSLRLCQDTTDLHAAKSNDFNLFY